VADTGQRESRFRSRKFLIAVWAMALVTVVTGAVVVQMFRMDELPGGALVMSLFGGFATVLGAYGASNAAVAISAARAQR
tara:strand:- start:969 stop:1208 length:240 start_codon:yes stop_codon:yes gene_type:complete